MATKKVKVKKFSFKRLLLLLLVLYIIGFAIYYFLKMPIKNIYIKYYNILELACIYISTQ